uniref:zinc finger BED domain-containing protein RICESLEEPER 2-like n=1 Tax=Erigeron canadensis TaxID=72917 RepID=UPI001CB9D4C4|nr:zinc finger BED domain-containing protein RICESLEEPER 2-like [Erigeron canadensis]
MSDQQSTRDEIEDEVSSSKSNKERSIVWSWFERFGPPGNQKASCTVCRKTYCANPNSGTSNMNRHIPKCFIVDENGPLKKRVPLDQEMYKENLAISIIKHNYPFSYVGHEARRDVHTFLHRDAKPITRNTAKATVINIYEREKMILKGQLEKLSGRICLTSDLWTSITTDGYMALTAHFVDENWVLRKKVLNFRFIPPPHSGLLLAGYLISFLADRGIEKKIFTITLDNAKYNDGLVDSLKGHLRLNEALVCDGDFTHIRYGAHIMNLIVQAGLKAIEGAIKKVRDSVKYVRGSGARKFKFAETIQQLNLQCGRQIYQDVPTRWNSTYLMLDCAIAYMSAYDALELVDLWKNGKGSK